MTVMISHEDSRAASLDDSSGVHDDNEVVVPDSRNTVCYRQDSNVGESVPDRLLDGGIGLDIDRGCRFCTESVSAAFGGNLDAPSRAKMRRRLRMARARASSCRCPRLNCPLSLLMCSSSFAGRASMCALS